MLSVLWVLCPEADSLGHMVEVCFEQAKNEILSHESMVPSHISTSFCSNILNFKVSLSSLNKDNCPHYPVVLR